MNGEEASMKEAADRNGKLLMIGLSVVTAEMQRP